MEGALLELRGLGKRFGRGARARWAFEGIDLTVAPGESVGLLGESGCGKTTLGRCALWLMRPTSGEVRLMGEDPARLSAGALRRLRPRVQMVFQDPLASLDPRWTVGETLGEALALGRSRRAAGELLERVGLELTLGGRRPHELSGGQRQRLSLARALALEPELLWLDEPTSSLDVSIQAQILNLLEDLRRTEGLSFVLVSHDVAVIRQLCERVLVMHGGRIVEAGPTEALLAAPRAPSTLQLLNARLKAPSPVAAPEAILRP